MRQKVAIARTILHNPDVILFDEPTTGLDITSANMFRELIKSLQREGKTIIFPVTLWKKWRCCVSLSS